MLDDDRDEVQAPSSKPIAVLAGLALVGLLAGPLTTPASAQDTVQLTIEPRESGCGDTTYCYEVVQGSLSDVSARDTVEITFVNPMDNDLDHNLHLADTADVDDEYEGNDGSLAFANTEDLSPGNETTVTGEIPSDAEGLYLWCTVGVHESQGMWEKTAFDASGSGGGSGSDDGTSGTDDAQNSSPGLGVGVALVALAGLAVAARHR